MLPALQFMRVPLLLGGTSNHFPLAVLESVGAWDPYNVTEDADLGLRLARAGYRVEVLQSTTMEEAPAEFSVWLPQRTRWIKGWIQTYLVHMRKPQRLLRDLGLWRFTMLQALLGGFILSALMHPLFYVLIAIECAKAQPFRPPVSTLEAALWHLALFNLAAGFLTALAVAAIALMRRRWCYLLPQIVLMPAYWLLISFAAYRAVWQLLTAPHLWEKTRHKARTPGRGRKRTRGRLTELDGRRPQRPAGA